MGKVDSFGGNEFSDTIAEIVEEMNNTPSFVVRERPRCSYRYLKYSFGWGLECWRNEYRFPRYFAGNLSLVSPAAAARFPALQSFAVRLGLVIAFPDFKFFAAFSEVLNLVQRLLKFFFGCRLRRLTSRILLLFF